MRWKVKMKALQPISIANKYSSESQWSTTNYIPGSTWRGAFAEIWKYEVGFDDPLSKQLIENSIFRDAYPVGSTFYPIYYKQPKTMNGEIISVLPHFLKTKQLLVKNDEGISLIDTPTYQTYHLEDEFIGIAISRTRETTEDGKLYIMSSIAKNTIFETTCHIDEQILKKVAKHQNGKYICELYVGKKRFTGYGKVEVTFIPDHNEPNCEERIDTIQFDKNVFNVVFSSKSPLILWDSFLNPAQHITFQDHLSSYITDSNVKERLLQKLKFETTWGISEIRNGWQQVWDAPKTTIAPLKAGVTYIAQFENLVEEEKRAIMTLLNLLEVKGLGDRTNEGFGEIVVNPFVEKQHREELQQVTEVAQFNETEQEDLLLRARKFAEYAKEDIPLSQWQTLIEFHNPVYEIVGDHPDCYIEKRINKRNKIRNIWKKGRDVSYGVALREEVKKIVEVYPNHPDEAVNTYLRYITRIVRIMKKGERKLW